MKYVGYYNGEIGPLEEMKIPMLDRAVYFGDGCYDATTFAHNHIFAVKDHVDRFYNSWFQRSVLECHGKSMSLIITQLHFCPFPTADFLKRLIMF